MMQLLLSCPCSYKLAQQANWSAKLGYELSVMVVILVFYLNR